METTTTYPVPEGMESYADAIQEAYRMGQQAGRNAASWAADGNTTQEHARKVLRMLADGNPEAWDFLPNHPDLSGEWADDLTPNALAYSLGVDHLENMDAVEALSDAWEAGVSDTFGATCEEELRKVWGPTEALEEIGVTVHVGPEWVSLEATSHALYAWATRSGHSWPCSTLRDLDALRVNIDRGGLVDLELPGLHYSNQTGLYYERLDSEGNPFPEDDGQEMAGGELSAFLADHLAHALPEDHPCHFVAVGQFNPTPIDLPL